MPDMSIGVFLNILRPSNLETMKSFLNIEMRGNGSSRSKKTRKVRKRVWAIVQYDNRPLSQHDTALMARNKYYCEKYGYDYIFLSTSAHDVPPYWQKVFIVKDYLNKYKGILWLDTDATIFNMNIQLDSFYSRPFSKSINSAGNQIFNAGVWIITNTPRAHRILNDWIHQYDKTAWRKIGNKWETNNSWAGEKYEQGSFAYKIAPKYPKDIQTLKENILQSTDMNDPDTFILHFYSVYSKRIPAFLKKYPQPDST